MDQIYTYTVPMFIKLLTALEAILNKADEYVKANGISEADLLDARLAPDMFPLTKQVQIACDHAKGTVGRLTDIDVPKFEDTESTIVELRERIVKTLVLLKTVPENAFADSAERQVTLPYFPGKFMTGFEYVREYVIPNFCFHIVTAFAILRNRGIQIGKADFVGGLPLRDL